jgi:hypothetical protein
VEEVARTQSRSAGTQSSPDARRARRRRPLFGLCVVVALLLGTAAAVDGQLGVTLLACWVGLLVGVGWRISRPARPRRAWLVLGELTLDGEVGTTRRLPVVASRRAARVLRSRPRG